MKPIPHAEHRYPTVGDWQFSQEGTLLVLASDLGDPAMTLLVLVHELIESTLCCFRGIAEPSVTAFDIAYEKERDAGQHTDDDEPGDDPRAPYRREHRFAELIERLLAHELKVDWQEYERRIDALFKNIPLRNNTWASAGEGVS